MTRNFDMSDIGKLLWKYIDSWNLCEGRDWLGGDKSGGFRKRSAVESPPKMAGITVTFQVPPPHASACNQFLRTSAKAAGAKPNDAYGLPSNLELVYTAVENSALIEALEEIGGLCLLAEAVTHDEVGLRKVSQIVETALEKRGAGSEILDLMRLQREAVLEKSVEVAAELLKQLDD